MSHNGSTESSSYVDENWTSWFCNLRGNQFFCEVGKSYMEDSFNLFGLKQYLSKDYSKALDMILDRLTPTEPESEDLSRSAALLYGLIHARYIITSHGLESMRRKYLGKEFGECPRMLCKGQSVVPMGFSDDPKRGLVKLFCPKCRDVYQCHPNQKHVDGAFFGPTFPNLFFMSFEDLVPVAALEKFEPTVFGFRIHHSSNSISKKTLRLKDDNHPDQQGQGNEWNVNSGSLSNSNGHLSNNASNYTEWSNNNNNNNNNNSNRHGSNNYMSGTASATATGTDTQKRGFRLTKASLVNRIMPITSAGGMLSNSQDMIANNASSMDPFMNNSHLLSNPSQLVGLESINSNNARQHHSNQDHSNHSHNNNSNQSYMNNKPQSQDISADVLLNDSKMSTSNRVDDRRKNKLVTNSDVGQNVYSNDPTSGNMYAKQRESSGITSTSAHTTTNTATSSGTVEVGGAMRANSPEKTVNVGTIGSNDTTTAVVNKNTGAPLTTNNTADRKGVKRDINELTSNEQYPAKRREIADPDPKVSSDVSSTDAVDKHVQVATTTKKNQLK